MNNVEIVWIIFAVAAGLLVLTSLAMFIYDAISSTRKHRQETKEEKEANASSAQ